MPETGIAGATALVTGDRAPLGVVRATLTDAYRPGILVPAGKPQKPESQS